jgi:hypothetical protein
MPPPAIQPAHQPVLPLSELQVPSMRPIPVLVAKHREHHGTPSLQGRNLGRDSGTFRSLPKAQQEVFVHVLTRFAYGMERALSALSLLEAAAKRGGRQNPAQYAAIAADTRFVIDACTLYRSQVADRTSDPRALTPNYRRIFDQEFPHRITALSEALDGTDRRKQIKAEAQLRTIYHVIGEGIGALTGIWGMNSALREIGIPQNGLSKPFELPELSRLLSEFTLIERRQIAFGLSELGALARESYFATSLAVLHDFKNLRPILEKMRGETFARWGAQFPFDIDKEVLAQAAKKRVIHWLVDYVLARPGIRSQKELSTLGDLL